MSSSTPGATRQSHAPARTAGKHSTAEKDSTRYRRWTKRACKWAPKRLQTTPLTKPSRHMRKQLFFPPPSTPPRPFFHPGGSSWLIKAKSGELYPERQQEAHPDPSLWGSGKHSPTDWDRPAPPALVTARWAGPRISFCPVLKWQRGSHLFEVFQSINRQKPDSEFLP